MGAQNPDNSPNLDEICEILVDLAYRAGDIITSALPGTDNTGSKKNSADLVTEYDRAVEEMISRALTDKYPDYQFHGEETYDPAQPLTNAPTFIIDPIDGTVNFVHGFPHACVSLGFAVNRVPTVGVVFNPFTRTLYSAVRGKGAFVNRDNRLPLKGTNVELPGGLINSLISVEWGSERTGKNWETKIRTRAMVRSMRSIGSAALNLCAVAAGALDLSWEGGCWEWAGWIILEEAGGMMVGGNPGEWETEIDGRKYLAIRAATCRSNQKELVEEFWNIIQGRLEY
ncbi:hypothetical protein BJX64DRAFT_280482 [Aspergillus heterothallicus]